MVVIAIAIISLVFAFYEEKSRPSQVTTNNSTYSIVEFKLPDTKASPFFPIYDPSRNVIWVGDAKANSSRLWEFDINSKKFIEYRISGTNLISKLSFDSAGTIWYIDPAIKQLGNYDPVNNGNKLIKIPTNGTLADLVVYKNNVWIIVSDLNQILRYDITSKNFTTNLIPTEHGSPTAITVDNSTGYLWIVEAVGKILRVEPTSFQMSEFSPQDNLTLKLPVAIKINPNTDGIYISEHGEDAVFAFYSQNETFKRFLLHPDPDALPFGMAFDKRGNLWVAEHTINKIAVLDPRTGQSSEIQIPSTDPLTQSLTSDLKGNVWLAEPGGAALGVVNETGY